MATADQHETASDAIRTAATTLLGYGSTGGSPGVVVTATSTRTHQHVVFAAPPGSQTQLKQLWIALDRGSPCVIRTDRALGGLMAESSHILMAETPTEIFVLARLKK